MESLLDYFLHLESHLEVFVTHYGPWVYALLFLIIFAETGLVVTPILPGDSLLFTTGALAASGILDLRIVVVLLLAAAILGDAVNYAIGHFIGPRVFRAEDRMSFWHRMLNRNHLMKAHAFFERHGGKAIVLGRFVPIVRTFVPFVAGAATGGPAFTAMAPVYEPADASLSVQVTSRLGALRHHRADAHRAAWATAGVTLDELRALPAESAERQAIEEETNRLDAPIYQTLTEQERWEFLALLGSLPG